MGTIPLPNAVRVLIMLLQLLAAWLSGGDTPTPGDATPSAVCGRSAPALGDDWTRLVLQARPPTGVTITEDTLCTAGGIMAARLAGAGLDAAVFVDAGGRVAVLVPDAGTEAAARLTTGVGLLEIIDPLGQPLLVGTLVETSLGGPETVLPPSAYAGEAVAEPVYATILSGADVRDAYVTYDQFDSAVVGFELTEDAAVRFYEFTSANVGRPMAILIDKRVVSSPTIQDAISDIGTIAGLREDEVDALVVQLNTETLPVPFEVVARDGTPVAPDGTPVSGGA